MEERFSGDVVVDDGEGVGVNWDGPERSEHHLAGSSGCANAVGDEAAGQGAGGEAREEAVVCKMLKGRSMLERRQLWTSAGEKPKPEVLEVLAGKICLIGDEAEEASGRCGARARVCGGGWGATTKQ